MRENTFVLGDSVMMLLEGKKYSALKDILCTMNPADIAILFSDLESDRLPLLFRILPPELAARTFVEMDSEEQELLIKGFSDNELREVIDELYADDAVDIIEEMPADIVKRILQHANPEMREMINALLNYPEDSAGSMMTVDYVALRPDMTAENAIKRIRRTGVNKKTIYACYITGDDGRLMGYISIKDLILAPEDAVISDIMEYNTITVGTLDDQETVAGMFSKYDFIALPVADMEGRLVGIITVDDAMDVIQDEATEDIEKMAAIVPSEKPYLKMSAFEISKLRIPWLMFLMISATFTGMIISSFENALAACTALTAFIPMLMDTAGNTGSQSSTTIIRGMSLHEIEFSDVLEVIWKEIRVAVICGFLLAVVNFLKILIIDKLLLGTDGITLAVDFAVCASMFLTVFCAKFIGCVLPMGAKKVGLDPAVMASPLITTILDTLSLLIYFYVASSVLGI